MEALDSIGRCGAWSLTASDGETHIAVPMRCRRWRCPRCGPAMRNRLIHLVGQTTVDAMWTLTADTKQFANPYDAARRLSWALPRLIANMRKWAAPAPIEYLAVWERTQAGWPHLHVLVRGPFVPQRLVSKWWQGLALSPIVDVQRGANPKTFGRYAAKYLTKDPDPFGQGRALRTSRGFLPEPMRPQGKRFCTLGALRVFEGRGWEWLADRLQQMDIVEVDDYGQCVSAPWASQPGAESTTWLRWTRQREAVARFERPPPPDTPLLRAPAWAERSPGADAPEG